MLSFETILNQIENGISNLKYDHPPTNLDHPPTNLYEPIRYILSLEGKRIRPALTFMAFNLYKENTASCMQPALALEVFHNFTLLHDDLMDQADIRRHKPTIHKVWSPNTAILSGDAMLISAYQLIAQTPEKYLKEILDLFSTTALEICEGQQYDMEFEGREDVDEKEYIEMIRLKTAVLLACALKMGAILADAPQADQENMYQFGINIGLAFQLQDDLLDVYGDSATFGKKIGGDILTNKKTFLLINALKKASEPERKMLTDWQHRKEFIPEEKIRIFTEIYNQNKIKETTIQKIEEFYLKAMSHLSGLSVAPKKLSVLISVTNQLMNRQS
ncbi:MAG: polyprenyl synthetase family protein [Tannerellaceae bacterium]|nr:polyprenyl synthetase family protein [Tannerellaceae bacterium]MCD8263061.1 polyprenyl synthetase family protein [Tannerellaceae bacterium]